MSSRHPSRSGVRRLIAAAACTLAAATTAPAALAAPKVAVLVESPPGPVQPGGTLVYRIHVSNLDKTTATGPLKVSADIPQHSHVTREPWGKCSPSRCDGANESRYGSTVSWESALAPGESAAFNLRLYIDNTVDHPPPPDGSTIELPLRVMSGATKVASATALVAAENQAHPFDLAVVGATRLAPGTEAEYSLRYGNTSKAAVKASLRLPLPSGASVVAASRGAAKKGNAIEWDLGAVPAGYSDMRSVRLKLDAGVAEGTLLSLQPELLAAGRGKPARADLGVHAKAAPALAVSITAAPDPATPGGTIVHKLELTNQSADAPTGAFVVQASIPSDGVVTRLKEGKCAPSRCDGANQSRHGSHVVWEVPSLAPGATAPLQFAFVVDKPDSAAPPPHGTLLSSHVETSLGTSARVATVLGTAQTVGRGVPLEPLGSSAVASTPPPASPPPAAAPPEVVAQPTASPDAEPEPPIEEIPDTEIVAELPPADDEQQLPKAEAEKRTRWKLADWDRYCSERWKAKHWDRHCAKRWWKRSDWSSHCKAEGKKHRGWRKFCARDFARWKFAQLNRHKWSRGKDDHARHRHPRKDRER